MTSNAFVLFICRFFASSRAACEATEGEEDTEQAMVLICLFVALFTICATDADEGSHRQCVILKYEDVEDYNHSVTRELHESCPWDTDTLVMMDMKSKNLDDVKMTL